ncbi:hypothetical protein BGW42_000043 [Actinomortierella wolfii]|nr:hypothetical protein BGW42_000043 [Actinomortierella wolfii]
MDPLSTEPLADCVPLTKLDARAIHHLRAIARQSIASSCLEPEILWLRQFMDVVDKIATNAAEAWYKVETAHRTYHQAMAEYERRRQEAKQKELPTPKGALETGIIGTVMALAVLPGWRSPTDTSNSHAQGHQREASSDSPPPKPRFQYDLMLSKHISTTSSQDCTFTPDRYEGEPILKEELSITEQRRKPNLLRDHQSTRSDLSRVQTGTLTATNAQTASNIEDKNGTQTWKRASIGSSIFSWFSRGSNPVKYKKGTFQLAQDPAPRSSILPSRSAGGGGAAASPSIAEDFGMTDDIYSPHCYRFAKIVQQIEKAIISVSPDTSFPPPYLLMRLRDEEINGTDSKRKSYTWEDIEFVANKIGFGNRMSRISLAPGQTSKRSSMVTQGSSQQYNSKVARLPIDSRAGFDHLMTNNNSLQGIFNHQSISFSYSYFWSATAAAPCKAPHQITIEYYRKTGEYEDMPLSEMIELLCKRANSNCSEPSCGHKRLEHISSYTHGEARVNITIEQARTGSGTDFDSPEFAPFINSTTEMAVWTKCKTCKARTTPHRLSQASRLYSFGKYLEILLYCSTFEPGPRPLCPHAGYKDEITRCFLYRGLVVNFDLERIDLFEMRIPRLQVSAVYPAMPRYHEIEREGEDDRRLSVAKPTAVNGRSLPVVGSSRATMISLMPSTCDVMTVSEQYLLQDETRLEITHFYDSCKKIVVSLEQHLGETRSTAKVQKAAVSTVRPEKKAALEELDQLGERWKADEFELYELLSFTPVTKLNDVRIRLADNIKRTMKTIETWQTEHVPETLGLNDNEWVIPEYARSKLMHTFPGSSVIVREDEPSSIIANALCCKEYLTLLSKISNHENDNGAFEQAPEPPKKDIVVNRTSGANNHLAPPAPKLRNSHSSKSILDTRKSGSSSSEASTTATQGKANDGTKLDDTVDGNEPQGGDKAKDDEDDDDDAFLVIDGYQTNAKYVHMNRKDLSSLLLSPNGTISSTRSTIGLAFGTGRHSKNVTTASSLLNVDKRAGGPVDPSTAGSSSLAPRPVSMMVLPSSRSAASVFAPSKLSATEIPNEQAASTNKSGYLTVKGGDDTGSHVPSASTSTPDLPSNADKSSSMAAPPPAARSRSSFGYHALASGLTGSIKGLSSLSDKFGRGFTLSSSQLDRLSKDEEEKSMAETLAEHEHDEGGSNNNGHRMEEDPSLSQRSPHIKVQHAHGKTSFSCTVYFAAEFDTLRRRCGIHEHYVQSLARCAAWNASGGKSKSSFYKTKDDRFVVKQMISSWNMAEKDELLKFAPMYFAYMEKTQESPTVLAKIFGFYSFKIKNGNAEKSEKVYKIDVLVMENLFYNQKITRTFDLKGIQARHAATKTNTKGATAGGGGRGGEGGGGGGGGGLGATTLWDGDFIEGRFKALLLLYSHSKKIIRESLDNDTEFLANANIMDYSLLVGVDDERKELVVGIVDFIGAYTWYKRIESKGKTTLRGAKDNVTVLPPLQYRTRFRQAMEQYFLAVPDKWSKNTADVPEPPTTATDTLDTAKGNHHSNLAQKRRPRDTAAMPSPIPEGSREDSERMQQLDGNSGEVASTTTKIVVSPPSKPATATSVTGTSHVAQATALSIASGAKGVAKKVLQQHATEAQQEHFHQQLKIPKLPRVFYPLEV